MNRLNIALFYILCFTFGMYLVHVSWAGLEFVFLTDSSRLPASFQGPSINVPSEYQFSAQSELKKTEDGYEVYLNQFVMRDRREMKSFVCQVEGRIGVFDRVELKLVGVGISEAGRTPHLYIESDCKSTPSPAKVGPIRVFVPMAEILKLKPVDQEIQWYGGDNRSVRVVEMVSEWPTEWRLESVTYKSYVDTSYTLTLPVPVTKESPSQGRAFTLMWSDLDTSTKN